MAPPKIFVAFAVHEKVSADLEEENQAGYRN